MASASAAAQPVASSGEEAEVAALDRVLTRTVMTPDDELGKLLVKLLPALVQKLATTQPKIRVKVLELLNHINKRVKAVPATQLPLLPMVQLAMAADGAPLVRSMSLVYVELGIGRAPAEDQLAAVPLLLSGLSQRPAQHQAVALRAVIAALSQLQPAPGGSYSQVTVPRSTAQQPTSSGSSGSGQASGRLTIDGASVLPPEAADRALLLGHLRKVLLYQRPSLSGGRAAQQTPLGLAAAAAASAGAAGAAATVAAASAAAAAAAAAPAAAAPSPPPGLSSADVALLEEKGVPEQEQLSKQKLGALCLLAAAAAGMPGNTPAAPAAAPTASDSAAPAAAAGPGGGSEGVDIDQQQQQAQPAARVLLSSEELLLPLLAAACDPYEAVARRGGELLTKIINPEAAKPAVDLEQEGLAAGLMDLLLGDQDPRRAQPAPTPANPAMALRIMGLLVRSVAATRLFPGSALVMQACLSGPATSPRLVRLGAEWTGWVFKHAPPHQLKAMAGPVTHKLLAALGLEEEEDAAAAAGGADGEDNPEGGGLTLRQVGGGGSSGTASLAGSTEARGYVFSALAQLAHRMPELFQDNTSLASRLFAALAVEPPGSRAALQEALGALSVAVAAGISGGTPVASAVPGSVGSIQQAAAAATAAGKAGTAPNPARLAEMEELLQSSMGSDQAAVRLCAVQWATRLFPRTHLASRYVCLLAAGDSKPEVRDVGLTGLGLAPTQLGPAAAGGSPSAFRTAVAGLGLPPPGAVVAFVADKHRQLSTPGDLSRPLPLPDATCQALVAFIHACATASAAAAAAPSAGDGAESAYDAAAHALLLENLACRGAGRDTVAAVLEGLVPLLSGAADWMRGSQQQQDAAAALRQRYSARQAWLQSWLAHSHGPVRTAAARLLALAASPLDTAAADALLAQVMASLPATAAAGGSGSSSKQLEEQEGAMLAVGMLLAKSHATQQPPLSPQAQQAGVTALVQQLQHHAGSLASSSSSSSGGADAAAPGAAGSRQLTLAGAAALALGFCGLVGVALPDLEPPPAAAAATDEAAAPAPAAAASSNGAAKSVAAPAPAPPPLLRLLLALAGCKDGRAVLRAVTAVGYIGAGSGEEQLHLAAARGLLGLCGTKGASEEVLLALGEALAAVAGDVGGLEVCDLLWATNMDTLADAVDARQPPPAADGSSKAPPAAPATSQAMDMDAAAAAAGSRAGVQRFLLSEVAGGLCGSPKEDVRCAGCVALVSLLQLCSGSALLRGELPRLQATFTSLLGDSNELTQDLAARGVSLVYSRGGTGLQQQLLGQLLGVLQGAGSGTAAAGSKLTPDTKVFAEGQVQVPAGGSAAGGSSSSGASLTTYRELCSLADDMGQPDLIYRFMEVARASSALSAKRGAAVGVARIARLAASAAAGGDAAGGGSGLAALLGPERLTALLPKLYRLSHDPSPKVSESMSAIWAALLDDPRAALDKHFDVIAKSLLSDMGGRMWRVRQAACAAMADLLMGRRWAQLAPHFETMWTMALRAFDDVKESVRAAAAGLLRTLRGLSLRLMDRQQTPATDVAACCVAVLPLLAGSQGLGSGVNEVRAISADVLCSGIKSAGPAAVAPVLPVVVPVLLEALSGLEDARLNYVEQHAERVGIDSEKLAAARLAAAHSSAISEALDACCRALAGPAVAELAPGLASLIRRGVGLSSKAGTARFIKSLAARLGAEMRPAAPTLLKPLTSAVASEGSSTIKKAYAGAAAAIAVRCVGDKRQEKFVGDAVAAYGAVAIALTPFDAASSSSNGGGSAAAAAAMSGVEPAGGSSSEASSQAGGLLLRELLRESADTFAKYASQVLPVAFLASQDEVPGVSAAWAAVWSEGCPSEPAALRMHTPELAGLIAGGLSSSTWGRKRSAAKALIVMSEVAPEQLAPFSPALAAQLLAEGAEGRLWDGKEGLLTALGALAPACLATLAQQPGVPAVVNGLLAAAARKKTVFRTAALAALQKLLDSLAPSAAARSNSGRAGGGAAVDPASVWQLVAPPMSAALQQHLTAASTPPPAANGAAAATNGDAAAPAADDEVKPLPLVEVCSCLRSAWQALPRAQQVAAAPGLVAPLSGLLVAPGFSWSTWLAVVNLAAALIPSSSSPAAAGSGSNSTEQLVPLAGGLVHVLQHSTVSQLRVRCLEALVQLLTALAGDPAGAAAFKAASTASGGGRLQDEVAARLADVVAQDPSAAHKGLAAQAQAALQQQLGGGP